MALEVGIDDTQVLYLGLVSYVAEESHALGFHVGTEDEVSASVVVGIEVAVDPRVAAIFHKKRSGVYLGVERDVANLLKVLARLVVEHGVGQLRPVLDDERVFCQSLTIGVGCGDGAVPRPVDGDGELHLLAAADGFRVVEVDIGSGDRGGDGEQRGAVAHGSGCLVFYLQDVGGGHGVVGTYLDGAVGGGLLVGQFLAFERDGGNEVPGTVASAYAGWQGAEPCPRLVEGIGLVDGSGVEQQLGGSAHPFGVIVNIVFARPLGLGEHHGIVAFLQLEAHGGVIADVEQWYFAGVAARQVIGVEWFHGDVRGIAACHVAIEHQLVVIAVGNGLYSLAALAGDGSTQSGGRLCEGAHHERI